jgi:hypothetical protein
MQITQGCVPICSESLRQSRELRDVARPVGGCQVAGPRQESRGSVNLFTHDVGVPRVPLEVREHVHHDLVETNLGPVPMLDVTYRVQREAVDGLVSERLDSTVKVDEAFG